MKVSTATLFRASRRLAFALGLTVTALAWMAIGQVPSRARAAAAIDGPDGSGFPAYPGARMVSLGDGLRVDGRRVSTTTFRTRAAPADVIAFHRRHFEELPVDIVENALPDGRALFVLNVREGRRCVVTARVKGGVTEVIRGWSPLDGDDADGADELPPLPDGVAVISRVDDGPSITLTAHAGRDPAALLEDLAGRFVGEGWESRSVADHEELDGVATGTMRFSREGRSATIVVGSMPEGGALVAIRLLPGGG